MKPLDLNLASRPYRNDSLLLGLFGLVLVVLLFWAVLAPLRHAHLKQEAVTLENELQAMREGIQGFEQETGEYQTKIATLPLEEMQERAAFAREILERRNFSWTDLFNNLEEDGVIPCDVRLMSLRPRYDRNRMFIDVRGISRKAYAGYLDFIKNLQHNPHFVQVNPRNVRKSNEVGGFIFDMSFSYFADPGKDLPEGLQVELGMRPVPDPEEETLGEDAAVPPEGEEGTAGDEEAGEDEEGEDTPEGDDGEAGASGDEPPGDGEASREPPPAAARQPSGPSREAPESGATPQPPAPSTRKKARPRQREAPPPSTTSTPETRRRPGIQRDPEITTHGEPPPEAKPRKPVSRPPVEPPEENPVEEGETGDTGEGEGRP